MTVANVHDITKIDRLLHSEVAFISADSGYRGAQKREELKDIKANWLTAEMPGKESLQKKHTQNKQATNPNGIH